MAEKMSFNAKAKLAIGVVLLALLIVPAPLLPPHRLAEIVQSVLGVGWKAAYFVAAVGLQIGFYGGVASQRYHQVAGDIEPRRDRCPALSVQKPGP